MILCCAAILDCYIAHLKKKKKKKNDRLCHQVPRCWPHSTACRSPGHGSGRPGLMVTYPENVQRNRWLGILDLILRTGNGVLEGLPGPPVVAGGCDSIQNGGQIRINPPPPRGDLVAPLHYLCTVYTWSLEEVTIIYFRPNGCFGLTNRMRKPPFVSCTYDFLFRSRLNTMLKTKALQDTSWLIPVP